MFEQPVIKLKGATKRDLRTQFAAVCYRIKNDKLQILMITSRNRNRWIVPKGWPISGLTPTEAAGQEAWEEAGVIGKVDPSPLGIFSYIKDIGPEAGLPCMAVVYPLRVKALKSDFPEVGQRRRKWCSQKKAALMASDPELAKILREFDPRHMR